MWVYRTTPYSAIKGRLDKIISPEGKEFSYQYDRGQLESMTYPNGITADYTFDDNGNLTGLGYRNGAGSVLSYDYSYDKNSMRTSMTDNDGTHDYSYDPLYQIIQASHPTPPRPLEQFQYDQVGNWLGNGRVHNELNQLTEDDSCLYYYDADGNLTEKINKGTSDTTYFVWDIESKLTEVRKPGMVVRYAYDALGRRMRKEVNGVSTEYRYDGYDMIVEMNSIGEITANYTFGPGIDNTLMMTRNDNSYYYVKDGLGSVTALTDNSGNVVHEYKYSVFGEIVEETGESIENPFTYTSREYDKETGNYYYRARYYSPQLGRFICEDPIGIVGGLNLFRYARNNTANYTDPYGLIEPVTVIVVVVIVSTAITTYFAIKGFSDQLDIRVQAVEKFNQLEATNPELIVTEQGIEEFYKPYIENWVDTYEKAAETATKLPNSFKDPVGTGIPIPTSKTDAIKKLINQLTHGAYNLMDKIGASKNEKDPCE